MTNEERLENISPIAIAMDGNVLISEEDWLWLSQQTRLAQELDRKGINLASEYIKAKGQNKRYREALEFYADSEKYHVETSYDVENEICGFGNIGKVIVDHGKTAREALEESLNGDR